MLARRRTWQALLKLCFSSLESLGCSNVPLWHEPSARSDHRARAPRTTAIAMLCCAESGAGQSRSSRHAASETGACATRRSAHPGGARRDCITDSCQRRYSTAAAREGTAGGVAGCHLGHGSEFDACLLLVPSRPKQQAGERHSRPQVWLQRQRSGWMPVQPYRRLAYSRPVSLCVRSGFWLRPLLLRHEITAD